MQSCNKLFQPFENCLSMFLWIAYAKVETKYIDFKRWNSAVVYKRLAMLYAYIHWVSLSLSHTHPTPPLQEGTVKTTTTIVLREYQHKRN